MNSFEVVLAVQFLGLLMVNGQAECYHGWSERVLEPKECKSDEDCAQTNGASCIFSLTANARVCCGLKPGAILPVCPPGKSLPPLGSSSGIVCDGPEDVDQCPEPFKCTESVTPFNKLPGQKNFICCSS